MPYIARPSRWYNVCCCEFVYIVAFFLYYWYWGSRHLYMFRLIPYFPFTPRFVFSKKTTFAAGGCSQYFCFFFCNTFFLCFKEKSISVCITVLYYILILFVHFSKSMYKQFAKNSTSFVHINKSTKSSIPSLLQTFFNPPPTLKVNINSAGITPSHKNKKVWKNYFMRQRNSLKRR